jgi:antirestriction protein ArdC
MSNQVYGYVTEKIVQELERGCVPWHKPWKTSSAGVRVPASFVSKKPYRPIYNSSEFWKLIPWAPDTRNVSAKKASTKSTLR